MKNRALMKFYVCLSAVVLGVAHAESKMVSVVCDDSKPHHILLKNVESDYWCDLVLPSYCHENQRRAAELSCGKRYAAELMQRKINYLETRNELLSQHGLDVDMQNNVESGASATASESSIETEVERESGKKTVADSNSRKQSLEQELLDISEALLIIRKRRIELERESLALQSELRSMERNDQLTTNMR